MSENVIRKHAKMQNEATVPRPAHGARTRGAALFASPRTRLNILAVCGYHILVDFRHAFLS